MSLLLSALCLGGLVACLALLVPVPADGLFGSRQILPLAWGTATVATVAVIAWCLSGMSLGYLSYTALMAAWLCAWMLHIRWDISWWILAPAGLVLAAALLTGWDLPSWLQIVLASMTAMACGYLVLGLGGERACAWAVVGLFCFDLLSWRSGWLESLHVAAVSRGIPLHAAASITVGPLTLGMGDLVASCLVGAYAATTLDHRQRVLYAALPQALALGGLILISNWALSPIPATGPSLLALGLCYHARCRRGKGGVTDSENVI